MPYVELHRPMSEKCFLSLDEKFIVRFELSGIEKTIDLDFYIAKSNVINGKRLKLINNEEAKNILLSYNRDVIEKVFLHLTKLEFGPRVSSLYCMEKNGFYYLVSFMKDSRFFQIYYQTKDLEDFYFHAYLADYLGEYLYFKTDCLLYEIGAKNV